MLIEVLYVTLHAVILIVADNKLLRFHRNLEAIYLGK